MPDALSVPADPAKVAIVLAADLAPGPAANIAACIAAGLAASRPDWAGRALVDASGWRSVSSSHVPITILKAPVTAMNALLRRLTEGTAQDNGRISLFPAYAHAIHESSEYWHRHGLVSHAEEAMLGVGLVGAKRWVSSMTGSLPLWR